MKNELCDTTDHTWACRQTSGTLGEVQNFSILSVSQVEGITKDPARVEEVCLGGEVVCNSCEIPFAGGEGVQAAPPIDFKALEGQLVVPASGKQP